MESFESRIVTLESSLSGIDSRVSRIETSKEVVTETIENEDRYYISPIQGARDSERDEETTGELQDPTDGIGSIVFTEEEDSGFFGTDDVLINECIADLFIRAIV